jgi:hypothetical protein
MIEFDKIQVKSNGDRKEFAKLVGLEFKLEQIKQSFEVPKEKNFKLEPREMKEQNSSQQLRFSSISVGSNEIKPLKFDANNNCYYGENLPAIQIASREGNASNKVVQAVLKKIAELIVKSSITLRKLLAPDESYSTDFLSQLLFKATIKGENSDRDKSFCVAVEVSTESEFFKAISELSPTTLKKDLVSFLNTFLGNCRKLPRSYLMSRTENNGLLYDERVENWSYFKVNFKQEIEDSLKLLPGLMNQWKQKFNEMD